MSKARDEETTEPARRAALDSGGGEAPGSARYVLDREIASGGMGRVFAGRDLRLERPVAIKMLRASDVAAAARFEREVKLAARLQHPGVVPVYDAGFWPSGEPFLVMKLVLGQSLARVIRDAETLADRMALLPHVIAAADAVAFAHDQSIVHRDLKPTNILVGAFGETVVVDWGLAKDLRVVATSAAAAAAAAGNATATALVDGAAASPTTAGGNAEAGATAASSVGLSGSAPAGDTRAGTVMGTPLYMPPEQAAGAPVDARADVYALGAILHHVLAGAPPQPPSERTSGVTAVLQAPAALAALEPRLPADLLAVVGKAMSPDRQERYPSAFELAEDLKRFQAGQLVDARCYSRAARTTRWMAQHPVAGIAALAALAAIATSVASLWLRLP
jgi:eukaryotic-like serine/threonine-protein kinase